MSGPVHNQRSPMTVDEIVTDLHLDNTEAATLRSCIAHYGEGYFVKNAAIRALNGLKAIAHQSEWQLARDILTRKLVRIFDERIVKTDDIQAERNDHIHTLAISEAEVLLRIQTQKLLFLNGVVGTLFLPIDPTSWNMIGWTDRHIDTDIDILVRRTNDAIAARIVAPPQE